MRIFIVKSFNIRKYYKLIRAAHYRNDGAERIVIAEQLFGRLYFGMAYRVIFIDYRNNSVFEKCGKGIAQVCSLIVRLEVLACKKYLSHHISVFAEHFIVKVHKLALTYGCRRLFHSYLLRAFGKSHFIYAYGYCSRRNKDYFISRVSQSRQHLTKLIYCLDIDSAVIVCKRRGSYLYDNSVMRFFH